HVSANPSRAGAVCERCGGPLIRREDDLPESIRVRMRAYEESTRPLLNYYQVRGQLLTIPARGMPDDILERSLSALGDRRSPGRSPAEPLAPAADGLRWLGQLPAVT